MFVRAVRQRTGVALFMCFIALAVLFVGTALPVSAAPCAKNEQEISIAITDPNTGQPTNCVPKNSTTLETNPIFNFLRMVVGSLVVGLGLAVVGGLGAGGVMYSTARSNPQQVQKAEGMIRNAIIALAFFVFTFLLGNFLIPGGIFI